MSVEQGFVLAEGVTMFIVATGGGATNAQRAMQFGRAAGTDTRQLALDLSAIASGARFNGDAYLVNPAPFDTGEWVVVGARLDDAELYANMGYTVNGQYYAPTNTPTKTATWAGTNEKLMVGSGWNTAGIFAADQYNGMICEILIYNAQLTGAQIDEVNDYLMTKYAIVPEPATLLLLGLGTLALKRRK